VLLRFEDDAETDRVVAAVQASGEAWMGGTVWNDRRAIRISVSNWQTSEDDVARTVAAFRSRPGVMAGREIADVYTKLREQALGFGSSEIKAPPVIPGGRALGVVMDMGYDTAVVSVLGLADGTSSIYVSNGGGTIGMGDHDRVAAASKRWVGVAETASGLTETDDDPLPAEGVIRFNVLTTGRRLAGEAPEAELAEESHPLFPLYAAGQQVIAEIRRVEEGKLVDR